MLSVAYILWLVVKELFESISFFIRPDILGDGFSIFVFALHVFILGTIFMIDFSTQIEM